MTAASDWWQTFFSGLFVDLWLRAVPPEQTQAEVDFLIQELQLPAGGRVLDVPCGGGRHSLELAARGFTVTGVDLSTDFLTAARSQTQQRQLAVTWEQRDIRDLPGQGVFFDGAFCFGNSFGYLDDAGNADFFRAVAGALKPGGRFALDIGTAAESILPNLKERPWYEIGDIYFLIHNRHDHVRSRLETEMTLIRGSQIEKASVSHRIYTYAELARLLADAGLGDVRGYSSVKREPYALGAHRLLLVATRLEG